MMRDRVSSVAETKPVESHPAFDSWGKIAQKIRVPAGTLLGVIFLLLMHPSVRSIVIGGSIALAGGLIRVWAAGHIEKGRVLTQGGPYALSRNPLYLGSLFMALGILVAGQGYWLLIPFALFFVAFYVPVMRAEEDELLQGHGEAFLNYARRVPLFFPRFRARNGPSSLFLWSRVIRNREHRTLIALILTEAFLILRLAV
jgi:protein-S-isoprenylcysteine O-methyltransferase Ste14